MYISKYIDTVYRIGNILNNIDSFKYFYGVSEYTKKNCEELFKMSNKIITFSRTVDECPNENDKIKSYRISLEYLSFLCRFLFKPNIEKDKPSSHDEKYKHYSESISSNLLNEQEKNLYQTNYKVIIDYIHD